MKYILLYNNSFKTLLCVRAMSSRNFFGGLAATVILGAALSFTAASKTEIAHPELPVSEPNHSYMNYEKPELSFVKFEGEPTLRYDFSVMDGSNNYARLSYLKIRLKQKEFSVRGPGGKRYKGRNADVIKLERNNGDEECFGSLGEGDNMPPRDYNVLVSNFRALLTSEGSPAYLFYSQLEKDPDYMKIFHDVMDFIHDQEGLGL